MKKYLSDIPNLLKEFHPNKNGDKKPENFTYGSGIKFWWLCEKKHEFQNSPNQRTYRISKSNFYPVFILISFFTGEGFLTLPKSIKKYERKPRVLNLNQLGF